MNAVASRRWRKFLISAAFAALRGASAWAMPILGEYVPEDSHMPPAACAIIFYRGSYYDPTLDNWDERCSGTIISKRQVLTAGHCAEYLKKNNDLGVNVLCPSDSSFWGREAKVKAVHPDYVQIDSAPVANHDIAVLEVSQDFKIPPIALAQSKEEIDELLKSPEECVMFGFGKDNTGDYGNFHGAKLQMLPYNPALNRLFGPQVFYSGGNGTNRATHGDSGGPVLCKKADGAWIQVAVHIQEKPEWNISIHERIDNNSDWLQGLLGNGAPNTPPDPVAQMAAQIDEWTGLFRGLQRQPAMDLSQVSGIVTQGLRLGIYDSVILGEPRGVRPAIPSAMQLVQDIAASGYPPLGSILRGKDSFIPKDIMQSLEANPKVHVFDIPNGGLNAAEVPVPTALQMTGHKLPISFTSGGRDMSAAEEAHRQSGKHPVIVSMTTEDHLLRGTQLPFCAHMADGGITRDSLTAKLQTFQKAWQRKMSQYPTHDGPIYFVRSPEQSNLLIGIVPSQDRAPQLIDRGLFALAEPEVAAWLQDDPIVQADFSDEIRTPVGTFFKIFIQKADGERFIRYAKGGPFDYTLYKTADELKAAVEAKMKAAERARPPFVVRP